MENDTFQKQREHGEIQKVKETLFSIEEKAVADIKAELQKPHQQSATEMDIFSWIKEWGFEHISHLTVPSKYSADWRSEAIKYNYIVDDWAMNILKKHFWTTEVYDEVVNQQ